MGGEVAAVGILRKAAVCAGLPGPFGCLGEGDPGVQYAPAAAYPVIKIHVELHTSKSSSIWELSQMQPWVCPFSYGLWAVCSVDAVGAKVYGQTQPFAAKNPPGLTPPGNDVPQAVGCRCMGEPRAMG